MVCMIVDCVYKNVQFLLLNSLYTGELIMNVLQESRVTQLYKMIGLQPSAKPSNNEV